MTQLSSLLLPENRILTALAGAILLGLLLALVFIVSGNRRRQKEAEERAVEADLRLQELVRLQAEMQGRLSVMAEGLSSRQSELNQVVNQRLDGMTHRIGTSIAEQTKSTHENLRRLQERLAVIDAAQNNIQTLAKDVVGLQAILSNKQTRGAFGLSLINI